MTIKGMHEKWAPLRFVFLKLKDHHIKSGILPNNPMREAVRPKQAPFSMLFLEKITAEFYSFLMHFLDCLKVSLVAPASMGAGPVYGSPPGRGGIGVRVIVSPVLTEINFMFAYD